MNSSTKKHVPDVACGNVASSHRKKKTFSVYSLVVWWNGIKVFRVFFSQIFCRNKLGKDVWITNCSWVIFSRWFWKGILGLISPTFGEKCKCDIGTRHLVWKVQFTFTYKMRPTLLVHTTRSYFRLVCSMLGARVQGAGCRVHNSDLMAGQKIIFAIFKGQKWYVFSPSKGVSIKETR